MEYGKHYRLRVQNYLPWFFNSNRVLKQNSQNLSTAFYINTKVEILSSLCLIEFHIEQPKMAHVNLKFYWQLPRHTHEKTKLLLTIWTLLLWVNDSEFPLINISINCSTSYLVLLQPLSIYLCFSTQLPTHTWLKLDMQLRSICRKFHTFVFSNPFCNI